ncbi:MAG TPA: ATP-binding protein [Geomonas sp.]|nr:ATP-binding protein [Geomonas sp.]
MRSIRGTLFTILFTGLIAIATVTGCSIYLKVIQELNEVFDHQLMEVAYAAAAHAPDVVPLPSAEASYEREARLAVQIWKGETLLYSSRPNRIIPRQGQGLTTLYLDDQHPHLGWRVFALNAHDKVIQVSQPLEARRNVGISIALRSEEPLMLATLLLSGLILLSVGQGLRPLKKLAEDISSRTYTSLTPLSDRNLPSEVVPLVRCINNLLEHLDQSFEYQSRFIADAAHELRTPLAVIRLQARVLSKSGDEALRAEANRQLNAGIERASRLITQLLTLARLEPEPQPAQLETLSLDGKTRQLVADYARIAAEKGIELTLSRVEPVEIGGDAESLRDLISNLVDNAIRYTPSGGAVKVAVLHRGLRAILQVSDTGPGIPASERDKVFERFYRLPSSAEGGSGLGLAIVKSALLRLGGVITLEDNPWGTGLKVSVVFTVSPTGALPAEPPA